MPLFSLSGNAEKSKSTTNSSGTFNNTTTPIVPEWASSLTQGVAGRVGGLLNIDPQSTVAGINPLQSQAAAGAANLSNYDFNYDAAADLTRGAAKTSWLDPYMAADTPFASGGKAYDFVDKYENPYLSQVVDASAADFDANSGRVRAQQALDLAGSGAFGGSGAALTQSMTEGELARARASTLSGLRSHGYETALGAASGDADRATQARIANAQLALQSQAQKVGFGFQGQQQQLQAANQLAQLSSGYNDNARGSIATQASVGETLRGVDDANLNAPFKTTQQIVAALNGLPISMFVGQNEQGTKQDTSTTKETKVSIGGGLKSPGFST